jgi:integrase
MKGYIRQRSKGRWEITIDTGRDPSTGKRLRHFESVKGRKVDAQNRLAELLVSIEKGSYVKPKRVTVSEWLQDWVDSYVEIHCSQRTKASYLAEIRRHIMPSLGQIPLGQLQPQHIQNYYAHVLTKGRSDGKGGLSVRTVEYHHRILREALDHAVKMGLIVRNVADAVDPPHPGRKTIRTLAIADVPRFLRGAQQLPYYTLFSTALFTGMRLGELLGLRWRDVDLGLASLSVVQALYKRSHVCQMIKPKSSASQRRIALSPTLVLLLRQHRATQDTQRMLLGNSLNDDDLVFANPDGGPLDPSTVTHAFARVLKNTGLPHIRFHDLRHTHATLMLMTGVHPKVVSERLGHANIGITLDTYSHVVPGLQEAAAERFDDIFDKEALQVILKTEPHECRQNVGNDLEIKCEPPGNRTLNLLIKSQLLCQLS